jgi:hypothetical protein
MLAGCPATVKTSGPILYHVGDSPGLYRNCRKFPDLFYLLAGQLYRHGAHTLLGPDDALLPLADLSRHEGKTLLEVFAVKRRQQAAAAGVRQTPEFDIKVMTLTGKTLDFKVTAGMLVEELKALVQEVEGELS